MIVLGDFLGLFNGFNGIPVVFRFFFHMDSFFAKPSRCDLALLFCFLVPPNCRTDRVCWGARAVGGCDQSADLGVL